MSKPNLDAMGHWLVSVLMQFNFKLEYQKGCDNRVANVISWVTTQLDPETVKSTLNGITLGMAYQAKVHDSDVTNAWNKKYESLQATHWWRFMLLTGPKPREKTQCWAQCWMGWRHRSRQIWGCFWWNMPPVRKVNWSYWIDRISQFIRGPCTYAQCPNAKLKISCSSWSPRHTTLPPWMGATEDAGHQGCDCTLSLLWECFWWPEMTNQVQKSIRSCMCCLQHEGSLSKVALHLIVSTAPMDLLHVDFNSIKITMELNRPKSWMSWCSRTISWNTLWCMWPLMRLQKPLPSFCTRVKSWSLELQPGS